MLGNYIEEIHPSQFGPAPPVSHLSQRMLIPQPNVIQTCDRKPNRGTRGEFTMGYAYAFSIF